MFGRAVSADEAVAIEALGYGAVWVGGSPSAGLEWAEPMLAATTTLQVASGIVNIWTGPASTVAEAYHRIEATYPGRFLLGIGVGHPEADRPYRTPIDALNEYLDRLDEYGVPPDRRVVAAVGPRLLDVAARRSAGAHPYLTTPEHTARARKIVGHNAFLAPEHMVVLSGDANHARSVARETLATYLGLKNAVTNFTRMGFTAADLTRPGSDRLVDAVVAHGATDRIAIAVTRHLDAGADHVPLQVLTTPENLVPALTELARSLNQ